MLFISALECSSNFCLYFSICIVPFGQILHPLCFTAEDKSLTKPSILSCCLKCVLSCMHCQHFCFPEAFFRECFRKSQWYLLLSEERKPFYVYCFGYFEIVVQGRFLGIPCWLCSGLKYLLGCWTPGVKFFFFFLTPHLQQNLLKQ